MNGVSTLSLSHLGLRGSLKSVNFESLASTLTVLDFSGEALRALLHSDPYPGRCLQDSCWVMCAGNQLSGSLEVFASLLNLAYLDCSGNQCK